MGMVYGQDHNRHNFQKQINTTSSHFHNPKLDEREVG